MGLHVYRIKAPTMDDAVSSTENFIESNNPYHEENCSTPFAVMDVESGLCKIVNKEVSNWWNVDTLNTPEKLNGYFDDNYYNKASYYVDTIKSIINQDVTPDQMDVQRIRSAAEFLERCAKFHNKHINVLEDYLNDCWPNLSGISDLDDYSYYDKKPRRLYIVLCDTEE